MKSAAQLVRGGRMTKFKGVVASYAPCMALILGLAAYPEKAVWLRRRDPEGFEQIVRRCVVLARQFRNHAFKLARMP